MAKLHYITRLSAIRRLNLSPSGFQLSKLYSSNSQNDDSDSDKDVSPKADTQKKNFDAASRLNDLLKRMIEDDTIKTKNKLELARPKGRRSNIKTEKGAESRTTETVEKKIVTAVKDVADSLGGNIKQTESELLSKLLNGNTAHSENTGMNLSDLVKGMKIDRETKAPELKSRAQQVRQLLQKTRQGETQRPQPTRPMRRSFQDRKQVVEAEPVNIFGAEPLGIFTADVNEYEEKVNKTWKQLQQRELRLAVTHPPANYFQEMIQWTEQGKLWNFPIDNEQGMEKEKEVYFADHIFLEKHLEPWCPSKGPVRHFMELVCVGLSKNPYMSVEDKRGHIEWYKNYFEDKMKLLKEVGAIPVESRTVKQIES